MTDQDRSPMMPTAAAQSESASTDGIGVPRVISADADLVAKPGAEQDSWFLISHLDSARGLIDLMIHYIKLDPPEGDTFVQAIATVLDPQTMTYRGEEQVYDEASCTFSTEALDVRTPMGSMSGTSSSLRVTAEVSYLMADLEVKHTGPLLANLGTGLLPFYGNINYEFAFPAMTTTGSVVLDGQEYTVKGTSWFDRQWGVHAARFWGSRQWTWFGVSLDNGDRISIWDILDSGREHAFATVVHPNGAHEVVDAEPFATGASDPWTSGASGQTYPTRWSVTIPAIDAKLDIQPLIREQEVVSPVGAHKYEGASTVTGTIRGEQVRGHAVAELVGNWRHGHQPQSQSSDRPEMARTKFAST